MRPKPPARPKKVRVVAKKRSKAARELVFAYGSNTDAAQMRRRCPSAWKRGAAELRGFELAFAGWSDHWRGAVATLRVVLGGRVRGVLWEVTGRDLERLDRCEGVPFAYRTALVGVRIGAEKHMARSYMLADDDAPAGLPSPAYVDRIRSGYRTAGINDRQLRDALKEAVGLSLDEQAQMWGE
jgi:hypothetical protein